MDFRFSDAVEPGYSLDYEESGVCGVLEFTNTIISLLLEKPMFSFLKEEVIEFQRMTYLLISYS